MSDTNDRRRPSPVILLDHGSIGYQSMRSSIDERWVEVILEDDEVEVTLVSTPAKLLALGLNIAGMVTTDAFQEVERVGAALDRIEAAVQALSERLADR